VAKGEPFLEDVNRATMDNMPDMALNKIMIGKGAGVDPVEGDPILKGWVPYYADGFTVLIPEYGDLTLYPPDAVSLGVGSSYEITPAVIRITAAAGTDNWLRWNLPNATYVFVYLCFECGGSGELFGFGVEDAAGDISWCYIDIDQTAADARHEKVVGGVSTITVTRAADWSAGDWEDFHALWKSDDVVEGNLFDAPASRVDISGVGPFTRFFVRFNNTSASPGTRGIGSRNSGRAYSARSYIVVMYK